MCVRIIYNIEKVKQERRWQGHSMNGIEWWTRSWVWQNSRNMWRRRYGSWEVIAQQQIIG